MLAPTQKLVHARIRLPMLHYRMEMHNLNTELRAGSLGGVIDEWIAGGARRAAVVALYGEIENWDVSDVTTMRYLFYNRDTFNADISKWQVSKVTDMGNMFNIARAFDCDIGDWDVSNVLDMRYMFRLTTWSAVDLSKWQVDKVIYMQSVSIST